MLSTRQKLKLYRFARNRIEKSMQQEYVARNPIRFRQLNSLRRDVIFAIADLHWQEGK